MQAYHNGARLIDHEAVPRMLVDAERRRAMVLNKRPPDTFPTGDLFSQFHKISKADWADLFADLYREAVGPEDAPGADVLTDALRRLEILKAYRKKEAQ